MSGYCNLGRAFVPAMFIIFDKSLYYIICVKVM